MDQHPPSVSQCPPSIYGSMSSPSLIHPFHPSLCQWPGSVSCDLVLTVTYCNCPACSCSLLLRVSCKVSWMFAVLRTLYPDEVDVCVCIVYIYIHEYLCVHAYVCVYVLLWPLTRPLTQCWSRPLPFIQLMFWNFSRDFTVHCQCGIFFFKTFLIDNCLYFYPGIQTGFCIL